MLWAAIALILVVLMAIGLAGARSSRRRQRRDGGESGYSPWMVADSGSSAHICDTNAAAGVTAPEIVAVGTVAEAATRTKRRGRGCWHLSRPNWPEGSH